VRELANAAPARPPSGPLLGAYLRTALPLLEQKLARGEYSLRNLDASVSELDSRELANVNTPDDLTSLSAARRRTS
jgi:molybdopterin-guanine dinucleotide biosynthesis protein A